ncbi:hypothetical protein ABTX61_08345 [Amycolatopsis japonica]|uniref:LuxE/PaaK family acyltransferase n=1 Tax=Amycolatopsis japonica TaxID=208439 RepID=UPI0033169576
MSTHLTSQALVPDAVNLKNVQALCDIEEPYRHDAETDALFVVAMNESNEWHVERSPFYANLFSGTAELQSVEDIARLPYIHANFFKTHEILSVPHEDVVVNPTSSGTTGQKSQMFWDEWTVRSGTRMIARIFDHYGWIDADPVSYLLYTNQPQPGLKTGSARTGQLLTDFAPAASIDYGLAHNGRGHEFDVFGAIRALRRFAEQGTPVRIFGFPAFLSFTLDRMRDLNVGPLKLDDRSLILFGGGWKGNADKQIAKPELYGRIRAQLGVPDVRIRDAYGSVEHSIPYIECPNHNLHVPTWSRVLVRSVRTLEPLPFGERGYLQFISPYITSTPAQSVLMGDLGSLHTPDECDCGTSTPWFAIHGRAGVTRNRSCAVAAAELLKDRS